MMPAFLWDALSSLRGQTRRSPWGAFLIWLGLTIGTASMAVGFGLAESTMSGLAGRLPGDMDHLYWVDASTVVLPPLPGASQPVTGEQGLWRGLTVEALLTLVREGQADGFYFTIEGRPVSVDGKMCLVTMVVYGGKAPVLGERKRGPGVSLSEAAASGDLIVNQAFVHDAVVPGITEGSSPTVRLGLDQEVPIRGVVGPPPELDPVPCVFAPAELAPPASTTTSFGVYLDGGLTPGGFAAAVTEIIHQTNPNVQVEVMPSSVVMAPVIGEARTVAALSATGGLLVGVVALANVIGAAAAWILNKSRSLALRRALGAPPGVVFLHVGFDLGVLGLGAAVPGTWAARALSTRWGLVVGTSGLVGAGFVTVVAALAVGLVLARAEAKREPGVALGRGL